MKRNVFSELAEGFDALKAGREGKITLRTHAVRPERGQTRKKVRLNIHPDFCFGSSWF